MSLLKKIFGDSKPSATPVPGNAEPTVASIKDPIQFPRIMLCAPADVRERLSHAKHFHFTPFGEASPEILQTIKEPNFRGIFVHFSFGEANINSFIQAAGEFFPDLPCFVLCDQKDSAERAKYKWCSIGVRDLTSAHEIEEKLQRALFLHPYMKRDALRNALTVLKVIPTEAASHQKIMQELQNPQFDLEDITALIKKDPALTSQLLKIVNSAAFSRGSAVQSVEEAVGILGAAKLQALVASAWAFFLIDDHACEGFHPKNEWSHAVKIAERVRKTCEDEDINSKVAETAVTSAMLHDLGKLLLAANLAKDYSRVMKTVEKEKHQVWMVENELLGYNHAEVAGCILALWGVPLPVAEAVLTHHGENLAEGTPAFMIRKAHADGEKATS